MPAATVSGPSPDFLSHFDVMDDPRQTAKNRLSAERDISSCGMRCNIRCAGLGFNSANLLVVGNLNLKECCYLWILMSAVCRKHLLQGQILTAAIRIAVINIRIANVCKVPTPAL
jgi:hypothetical protein